MGIEPIIFSLATKYSTIELHLQTGLGGRLRPCDFLLPKQADWLGYRTPSIGTSQVGSNHHTLAYEASKNTSSSLLVYWLRVPDSH